MLLEEDTEKCKQLVLHQIRSVYKLQPVFIFGGKHLTGLIDELKQEADVTIIKSAENYKRHQEVACNRETVLVFLATKFGIGADLKHPNNAFVVVFHKRCTTQENLYQKLGRGSRSLGQVRGIFVTLGKVGTEAEVK